MKRRTLFFPALSGLSGCLRAPQPRLNVFNWSNYVAPQTIPAFERETGIAVRYAVYESNEEMLARVFSGNSGWDVAFPTHYFIAPMRALGLLQPLDQTRLRGIDALDPMFRTGRWTADLGWCLPYMWGSTGIISNPRMGPPARAWRDLWEPRWRGRITMLDDPSEVLGAALKTLGYSINSTSEDELRAAQRAALKQKPLLRAYLNAEVRDQIAAGDLQASQLWATTAQQAIDGAPHLEFHYPAEGFPLYADCAVILKESRRAEFAYRFLDYLLRPEVAAAIVKASRTGTANAAARDLLPPAIRNLRTLYPDEETLARGEWFATMPSAAQRLRDRLWTEIKAA
jgi:spermidine/putrescine-binding protein